MKYYLHTLDGKPAGFAGEQICYAQDGPGWKAPLAKDLKTIRREQKMSFKFRKEKGWDLDLRYGYVILEYSSKHSSRKQGGKN